jgi:hypothetical protein
VLGGVEVTPQQLDIDFTTPPSHRNDPETSRAAARKAAGGAANHRHRILQLLAQRGDYGTTAYEAFLNTGGVRHAAGTRLGELERAGLVAKTERRRDTDTGSPAVVWVLTGYHA